MSDVITYEFETTMPDGKVTKIKKQIKKSDLAFIDKKGVKRQLGILKVMTPTEFPNKKIKKTKEEKPKPPKPK